MLHHGPAPGSVRGNVRARVGAWGQKAAVEAKFAMKKEKEVAQKAKYVEIHHIIRRYHHHETFFYF
jgi:hypothetical protein